MLIRDYIGIQQDLRVHIGMTVISNFFSNIFIDTMSYWILGFLDPLDKINKVDFGIYGMRTSLAPACTFPGTSEQPVILCGLMTDSVPLYQTSILWL